MVTQGRWLEKLHMCSITSTLLFAGYISVLWMGFFCLIFCMSLFLPHCLFLSPSLWSILFFHIYSRVSVFCLSFPLIPVCSSTPSLPSPSLFPSLFFLNYLSLFNGDPSLTRSPWSSRAQWRESWIWWTTCPALSATTTRCPPGLASTAPTRRSIITKMMTHSLHFMCRAAQVIKENEKWLRCSPWFKIWLLKNPAPQTIFFSHTQARKRICFFKGI